MFGLSKQINTDQSIKSVANEKFSRVSVNVVAESAANQQKPKKQCKISKVVILHSSVCIEIVGEMINWTRKTKETSLSFTFLTNSQLVFTK